MIFEYESKSKYKSLCFAKVKENLLSALQKCRPLYSTWRIPGVHFVIYGSNSWREILKGYLNLYINIRITFISLPWSAFKLLCPEFVAKLIIIASNKLPEEWYNLTNTNMNWIWYSPSALNSSLLNKCFLTLWRFNMNCENSPFFRCCPHNHYNDVLLFSPQQSCEIIWDERTTRLKPPGKISWLRRAWTHSLEHSSLVL